MDNGNPNEFRMKINLKKKMFTQIDQSFSLVIGDGPAEHSGIPFVQGPAEQPQVIAHLKHDEKPQNQTPGREIQQ